jgi:hypothetical protein
MQINHNRSTRPLSWAALLFVMTLALPALAGTTYPLRIRGSNALSTRYNNGNLVIEFEPGAGPAGDGLQPGQGSWLDRGLRPTEPHLLQETVPADEAKGIAEYLSNPDHYATFFCANSDQGYFVAFDSAPQEQGSVLVWAKVLNIRNDPGSPDGATVVIPGDAGGVNVGNSHDERDRHEEKKDHHDADKDHHDEGKDHHGKDHHEPEHRGGGEHHGGVSLVKAQPKPLIKQRNSGPPKPAPKSAPRPTPKKKK